uniref:Uncharacterized protein n=1 Tax=Quercus lobata TaxID=97700 RepID=A0A7N2MG61_QUELO
MFHRILDYEDEFFASLVLILETHNFRTTAKNQEEFRWYRMLPNPCLIFYFPKWGSLGQQALDEMASLVLERIVHECLYMWINLHAIQFYVDGKWGYDESKHHVTGDYGIVYTLHLSTDDMDVDNDAFLACG